MAYPHNGGGHHLNFGTGLPPIGYAQASTSTQPNASMLGNTISSHSFPMTSSTSAPHVAVQQHHHHHQQHQHQHQHQHHQQQQQLVQQQQQHNQHQSASAPSTSAHSLAPPGVTDQDGLIAPPSMPLELDFDNLESASNYMHTYALSQGFDIRIQWSANNQTRICWSCFRGGFPESTNADGSPNNNKKRQIPKEKERRKRGSLKIGCPFRVQCTKNWKTGKMELRILEGRHIHPMESDRENLPSQVRRIKSHRKAQDSISSTTSSGNAAANAVAQAASLSTNPAPTSNGVASNLLANTPVSSAHHHLSLMTPTPAQHGINFASPAPAAAAAPSSAAHELSDVGKPSFERNLFNLLGMYDRSDSVARLAIEHDLHGIIARAESKLDKSGGARKRRSRMATPDASSSVSMSASAPPPPTSVQLAPPPSSSSTNRSIAALAQFATPHTAPSSPLRPNHSMNLAPSTPVRAAAPSSNLADASPINAGAPTVPSSGKGSARCSNCKEYGHNRRRCPLG